MAKFNLHVKASYCSYNVALLYVLGMDHWKKKAIQDWSEKSFQAPWFLLTSHCYNSNVIMKQNRDWSAISVDLSI